MNTDSSRTSPAISETSSASWPTSGRTSYNGGDDYLVKPFSLDVMYGVRDEGAGDLVKTHHLKRWGST